jgi:UPF0271 protein
MSIDLNSDLGEGFGAYALGDDKAVLASVTSANVACGFHAGDPRVLRRTVALCAKARVAVGAHPGYPDLQGFGRRDMACAPDEVYADVLYQIGAARIFCVAAGVRLEHVKPHGALYNKAAKDPALAKAVAEAVRDAGEELILLGLGGTLFESAAAEAGIPFAAEAFADRAYQADGTLVPRSKPGAVLHDVPEAAARVVRMAAEGVVTSIDGVEVALRPHSICLHGDTAEAVTMAGEVRAALEAAGISLRPLREVLGL